MDIIDYFALERLYIERRRRRKKVYVTAIVEGFQREGKILKENEGRWLIEFLPYEDDEHFMSGVRLYMTIRDFEIHPIDKQIFEQHLKDIYKELL
jgi:hypothetical protein